MPFPEWGFMSLSGRGCILLGNEQLRGLVSSHFLKALLFCPVYWVLFCTVRRLYSMYRRAIDSLDGYGLSMSSKASWAGSLVPSVAMWRREELWLQGTSLEGTNVVFVGPGSVPERGNY